MALLSAGLLAACWGDDPGSTCGEAGPPPDPAPAAGQSRRTAIDNDFDADGIVDEITRFTYDAADRLAVQATYRAVDGLPSGEPVSQTRWAYDAWSRVVEIGWRSGASATEAVATMVYCADGRLAASRYVAQPGAPVVESRFTWRDGRIVAVTTGSGAAAQQVEVSYGDDGFVSRVRNVGAPADQTVVKTYAWRPDGRLRSTDDEDELHVVSYDLLYDAEGRHVGTEILDDGMYVAVVHLGHDGEGRLVEAVWDTQPDPPLFVPRSISRHRWESVRCQPVVMPGLPPHMGDVAIGEASPTNTSFGCGP